ncbi:hypothetical protein ACSBR1_000088 [Camellia fascicularis]
MTALSNSLVLTNPCRLHLSSGFPLKSVDLFLGSLGPNNSSFRPIQIGKTQISTCKRALTVQAGYGNGGRPGNASTFIGGFVLGGLVVGTLGCVFAPQISKALAGADKNDLMKKLPKFIFDEEKALEALQSLVRIKPRVVVWSSKTMLSGHRMVLLMYVSVFLLLQHAYLLAHSQKTRKVLEEKIAQLGTTIDNVSASLRSEDAPNGAAVDADELEAAI